MNSRERTIRAIKFDKPDRVPYSLPKEWGSDIIFVTVGPNPEWIPQISGQDEWGYVWGKATGDKTMGQVQGHPLDSYDDIGNYKFPDYTVEARYVSAKEQIKANNDEKFVIADIPFTLIHRIEYLRGNENAWTDPYLFPEELCFLLDKFVDIAIETVDKFADIGAHGIFSCDDWGLQDRLLVSPEIFREFFKPRYARVYHHAHERGLFTFLHSCGDISQILDDLIEAEVDVIQMDQQENMGLESLSKRFGGKICFWCPVDIQKTMINGTVDDVRMYARKLIDSFGRYNGGFIAKWYPSPDAVQHDWTKINAMSEAFIQFGQIY